MLAKLYITPPELRVALLASEGYLVDNDEMAPSDSFEIAASALRTAEESDWIQTILYFYSLAQKANSTDSELFYNAIEAFARDETAPATTRINAYLFLRIQDRPITHVHFLKTFVPFVCQAHQPEALAVLLLDPSFPEKGLEHLNENVKEHVAHDFAALIEWASVNTDAATAQIFIQHFTALKSPLVTSHVIELGLQGKYSLYELHDLLAPLTEIIAEDKPLFFVFFLDKMLKKYPAQSEEIIKSVLKSIREISEHHNAEIANEVFRLFVAPALKTSSYLLLNTGKKIYTDYPQLRSAFAELIPDMPLDSTEAFDFITMLATTLANEWTEIESEEDLPENIKSEIKAGIASQAETLQDTYAAQLETFRQDYGYPNLEDAKSDFPGFLFHEKAMPIMEEINKESKSKAQQKMRFLLSALTAANDYSGLENKVSQLLNNPDFRIENHYDTASEAFKKLPDAIIAMQLYHFKNKTLPSPELRDRIIALHASSNHASADQKHRFTLSVLAHQIAENTMAMQPETARAQLFRDIKAKGTAAIKSGFIHGKEAKTPFLSHILTGLLNRDDFTRDDGIPFVWELYLETYFKKQPRPLSSEEIRYSVEKLKDVHAWLKDVIFENPEAPETQAIKALSLEDRANIFGVLNDGTNENFDLINLVATSVYSPIISAQAPAASEALNGRKVTAIERLDTEIKKMSNTLTKRNSSTFAAAAGVFKAAVKGNGLNGKAAKIHVLSWVSDRLRNNDEFAPSQEGVPLIWDLYVDAYLKIIANGNLTEEKILYSSEKLDAVNTWLTTIIFDTAGVSETEALKFVPENILKAIFGFEGSKINPLTLEKIKPVTERRSSFTAVETLFANRAARAESKKSAAATANI